ncbi:hypothetical protein HN873_039980, partial [Arachis hypogaea]
FGHTILYANQLFVIFTALIWIKPLAEIFVDSLGNPFFNHSILLATLHEAVPGKRYNRYVELAQATFGKRLGVWLALFPTVYLSAETATALILIGGKTMKLVFQIVCGPTCTSNNLTTVEWYLATMPSTFKHLAQRHLDTEHLDKECGKGPKIFFGYSDCSWLSIRKAKSTIKLGMAGRLCIFSKSIVTPQEFVHEGTLGYRLHEGKIRYDAVIVVVVASFVVAALVGCGHSIPHR